MISKEYRLVVSAIKIGVSAFIIRMMKRRRYEQQFDMWVSYSITREWS